MPHSHLEMDCGAMPSFSANMVCVQPRSFLNSKIMLQNLLRWYIGSLPFCGYIVTQMFGFFNNRKVVNLSGFSNPRADLKCCSLAAVSQADVALRGNNAPASRALRGSGSKSYPSQHKRARVRVPFCVGWGSWIRTSENARVKVWCLTAWLYPNYLIDLWYYITFYSICQELFFFFSYFFCFCLFFPNLQKIMYLFWIILLLFY